MMNYRNMPRYNCSKVDYKKELLKYKSALVALNSNPRWKSKIHQGVDEMDDKDLFLPIQFNLEVSSLETVDTPFVESCESELIEQDVEQGSLEFLSRETLGDSSIEDKIALLEKEPMITFKEEYGIDSEPGLFESDFFLYHGIRFGNQLEVLEKILKDKKILAGKYIDGYNHYYDNCNDGEYVSLINYSNSLEFETFIRNNICFVISPLVEAYKTKYLRSDEWNYMKKNKLPVKNRYSYARYEYQVKDQIPLEQVRAIGISGRYLLHIKLTQGYEMADWYKQQIIDLLEKYSIEIPIVDIDYYNTEVYLPNKEKVKK